MQPARPRVRSSGCLLAGRRRFLPRRGPPAALPDVANAAIPARGTAEGACHDLTGGANGGCGVVQRSSDDLGAEAAGSRHGIPAFFYPAALALIPALRLLKHVRDCP